MLLSGGHLLQSYENCLSKFRVSILRLPSELLICGASPDVIPQGASYLLLENILNRNFSFGWAGKGEFCMWMQSAVPRKQENFLHGRPGALWLIQLK